MGVGKKGAHIQATLGTHPNPHPTQLHGSPPPTFVCAFIQCVFTDGMSAGHPSAVGFWSAMESATPAQRRSVLKFVTGAQLCLLRLRWGASNASVGQGPAVGCAPSAVEPVW